MKALVITTSLAAVVLFIPKNIEAQLCSTGQLVLRCQVGGAYNIAKLSIFSHCTEYVANISYENLRGQERVLVKRNSDKNYAIEDRLIVYKNQEDKWKINDILSHANADEPREINCY
ncbi:MAG: hypothetical protein IPM57_02380 [Oligoflexia bacterium]|nr:hypothetical protein [Oligoflexia bacterium]